MKIAFTGSTGQNLADLDIQKLLLRYKVSQKINLGEIDAIIYLAGIAHDLKKVSQPKDYYDPNFELTKQLYDAFLQSDAKKFYYIQAYEPEYFKSLKGLKYRITSVLSWLSYFLISKKIVNADLYKHYKNIRTNYVVYPGIDFEIFKPHFHPSEKIILGSIGRIETFKGTSYVLDAFLLAVKDHPDIELHVAFGDKSLEQLHPAIRVVVPKNDQELSAYYNSLTILIAAGTIQLGAIHYPVIEGMACGIPVINTGYYPSTNNNSWIVPIKDANAIALSISEILSDNEAKNIKVINGFESVKQFGWKLVAEKMYRYFMEN